MRGSGCNKGRGGPVRGGGRGGRGGGEGGGSSNAPGSSLTSRSQLKETESESSEHVPASNESWRFPSRRPDMGSSNRYDVTITTKHTLYNQRRTIINKLVHQYSADLEMCNLAYDGHYTMYSTPALPFESKKFTVSLTDEEERPRRSSYVAPKRLERAKFRFGNSEARGNAGDTAGNVSAEAGNISAYKKRRNISGRIPGVSPALRRFGVSNGILPSPGISVLHSF
ncbi:hypothetical protein CASFOL_036751 [Castilleja foliolosa]|uniref:Protein argonaute N-terminal domain-containing protein n=1 Tax=Castilleja foliolosa TaxID=1961234 RepID=A0ABD3BQB0_9LAMI